VALLLVGTDDGVVPFVDGARQPVELEGRRVHALTRQRGEWWAVVDKRTVVQRRDGGQWIELGTADVTLTCLLPAPGGAWCGTTDGRLLRLHEGAFAAVAPFSEVEGREGWHAVGSDVPYVRSLAETADHRALLANVHVGGIPRSGNGGASWRQTIDPDADVHQVRAHPKDRALVLAAASVGLAVSRDAGESWDVVTDGLHATYLRAVAYTDDAALVSACDGPFGTHGALYRWDTQGGGACTRITDGLPEWLAGNVDTGKLDADDSIAAFADTDGVYASDDAGARWAVVDVGGASVHGIGVAAA
jgi:hypothetical protein